MKPSNLISKIAINQGSVLADQWHLQDTKQINLFIGPNNSGKSREIRKISLTKSEDFVCEFDFARLQKLRDLSLHCYQSQLSFDDTQNIYADVSQRHAEWIKNAIDDLVSNNEVLSLASLTSRINIWLSQVYNFSDAQYILEAVPKVIDSAIQSLEPQPGLTERLFKVVWNTVYVPTLRSLRHIDVDDKYLERTQKDYFANTSSKSRPSIYTGHSLYEDLKKHLLGSHEQRRKVKDYEEYLSRSFFFGQPITIVPRIDEDVVYFKEGDKQERPIYDLGDGIQSIIMLTFPVFMAEKPTMFFIEEPEHYLHAGLQRTLIETLASFEEHMFFMTTHSNHFLDIAQERDDVSVQHVRREGDETIISPSTKHAELLTDLGVRASSVLLANCSIWVEGITDKLYLRTYLEKYLQELKSKDSEREAKLRSYHENLHYVFTEYQGSNITHWDFGDDLESNSQTPARKLSNNIMLIADADIDGKGDRVKQLEGALSDNFVLLEWKEVENYIPHNVLVETARKRWDTFNSKQNCSISRFANIPEGHFEHSNRGIGLILEGFVDNPEPEKRSFFKDKSGTIKDKVKFCRTAVEIMNDSDTNWELTPQLSSLCEKIWDFIEKHN